MGLRVVTKSDPWITLGPFCPLYFQLYAHALVDLWINLCVLPKL